MSPFAPVETAEHTYHARGAAAKLWASRAAEVVLSGPAGTGKSRACLEKLHAAALKYPGMRGMIVRKTQVSMTSTALVTWEEHVVPEGVAGGVLKYFGGSSREPAAYRYANGSTIVLGGMDKATKIMSSEYDMVYVQEAIELTTDDWEAILSRLRNGRMPYQQLLADTNPAQPTHWLKLRANTGSTVMYESRHEDNPVYFTDDGQMTPKGVDYIQGKLDRLTGVRFKRLRQGLWVAAEGLIYEDFDPAVHVIDWHVIPASWPRYWVVDFGFGHALVIQCWAVDPDGRLYLYRELFRRRMLVEDAARRMLDEVAPENPQTGEREWREPRPTMVICDHDREDRATLEKHLGFGTTMAHKTVDDGLQAVMARLRVDDDGKPRIYLMRDAVLDGPQPDIAEAGHPACTIDEFPGYVWDTGGGKKVGERPVKIFDDGLDALRYMVAQFDLKGMPQFRWMDSALES